MNFPHPAHFLLLRLAAQNVGRRLMRSIFLGLAVMISVGVGFSGFITGWALRDGIFTAFSRMGADLVIAPHGAMVNITSTLLTVQPTDLELDATLDEKLRAIPGLAKIAPQRLVRAGVEGRAINLIAYDPALDFTVEPWRSVGARGALPAEGLLIGERVSAKPGETLTICGRTLNISDRLGRTGVGPFDESYFVSFAGLDQLNAAANMTRAARPATGGSERSSGADDGAHHRHDHQGGSPAECLPLLAPGRVSAFLLQLAPGASLEQARFAIGQIPGIKIVAGNPVFTASRQSLSSLFWGVAIFGGLLLLALAFVVSLLFSAIVQERYREIGMLRALGARPSQITILTLLEATLITGIGAIFGIGFGFCLIFFYARSLGFYFASLGVPLDGPPDDAIWLAGGVAGACGVALGVVGALVASQRMRRIEPFAMIQMDNTQ